MRIRRLEDVTETHRASLRLHDEITVITGLDRSTREGLALELIGSIGSGRPGLSADIIMDDGRRVSIQRPLEGAATAVDLSTDELGSDEFRHTRTGPIDSSINEPIKAGPLDPLSSVGIARHRHRASVRLGRAELQRARLDHERLTVLANADQATMWEAAEQLAELEAEVRGAVAASREVDEHAIERHEAVEKAHGKLEALIDRGVLDDVELATSVIALFVMGIGVAWSASVPFAVPFYVVAACLVVLRDRHRQAVAAARSAENEALAASGVKTYLDHQLREVDGFVGAPERRARTLVLVERQQAELDRWSRLLGDREDITPRWALEHRDKVSELVERRVAERPTADDELGREVPPTTNSPGDRGVIIRHLAHVRDAATESLPLLLDDPFGSLDDFDLAAALDCLDEERTRTQFIVLTSDPRIIGWAEQLASLNRASVVHLGSEIHPEQSRLPQHSVNEHRAASPSA